MDYPGAVDYLFSLQKFGIKLGLSSTENLLERMGRPQDGLPYVHLAGSNGKGSVGATVVSILSWAGYKVGFFTSPHLVSFRERFALSQNGRTEMIGEQDVVRLTEFVLGACAAEEPPTFFEFVTAMAIQYFNENRVDLAVMETGMGGRLDATNVISPLVSVITNISLEHTFYLGRTLTAIAGEKAGIIKPKTPVICGEKRPGLRRFFEEKATAMGSRLYLSGRDFRVRARDGGRFDYHGLADHWRGLRTVLPGSHQVGNAALALAALEILEERGFSISEDQVRTGLENVSWPGRGEIFPGPPRLMLDGAHNPAAAKVLAAMLSGMETGRLRLVLGIMADKDMAGVMGPLAPLAHEVFLTRPVYSRAASPEALSRAMPEFHGAVRLFGGIPEAVEAARRAAGPDDLVVVTGSLFTVGEARAFLTGRTLDGLTG